MPDIGAIPSGAGAGLWVITTTYTSSTLLVELLCGSDRNFFWVRPCKNFQFYRPPQQQEAQERVALFARAKPLRRSDDQHQDQRGQVTNPGMVKLVAKLNNRRAVFQSKDVPIPKVVSLGKR